jgi:hypothetical protein
VFGGGAAEAARSHSYAYACDKCSVRDVPEVVVEVLRAEEVCFVYFVYFSPHSSVCLFQGATIHNT